MLRFITEKNNCIWTCEKCPKICDFMSDLKNRVTVMEKKMKKLETDLSKSNSELNLLKQKSATTRGVIRTYAQVMDDQYDTPTGPKAKSRRIIEGHITQNKTPLLNSCDIKKCRRTK